MILSSTLSSAAAIATEAAIDGIAEGATYAAVGDAVGQGVNIATGAQHGFSWSGLALAAVSGGVGAGITPALGPIGNSLGGGLLGQLATGAIASAATQGVEIAVGLQHNFDWTGVAVSAVEAGASFEARSGLDQALNIPAGANTPAGYAVAGLAGAAALIAGGTTRALLTGNNFGQSVEDELPSVIGQTVGNLIASSETPQSSSQGQSQNPLQALWGGIEHIGSEIVGGVEQVGGAIINGVETVGGAIVNGVETLGNDVVSGIESLSGENDGMLAKAGAPGAKGSSTLANPSQIVASAKGNALNEIGNTLGALREYEDELGQLSIGQIKGLSTGAQQTQNLLQTYYHASDYTTADTVMNETYNTYEALQYGNKQFNINLSSPLDGEAFYGSNITIGGGFFSTSQSEQDITIIHETSHTVGLNIIPQSPIDGTFGYAGSGFGNHETYDDNPNFFKLNTSQALNNADTLANFVYYRGRSK